MTKSTITREQLLEIIETDHVQCGEASYLARMALAAMDSEPVAYISKSDLDAGYPHILARRDFNKACTMAVYAAQPAPGAMAEPISFDEWSRKCALQITLCYPDFRKKAQYIWDSARETQHVAPVVLEDIALPHSWFDGEGVEVMSADEVKRACRAAMLQELKKSAGTEAICRSNENVQAVEVQSLTSINPAPDLVSLQKKAESIIGNYPGIPDCWCCTCRPVVLNDMRFVVCPDCGNKRCPRANDHRNACTGSNEPGQEGSAYPDTPQEVKGE
ncbi:hypothetical protein [Klebsiella pneumoniae]|uniref:hypothetical protein n=1 Tax=Klebsiella pneumoniae TaxID=573 RepID=UPI001E446B5A|nr:hypothetical protein [Klebsiella pneumoniae]MCD9358474.1 hypothetical protein [Klebsiella pneumoniae]